MRHRFRTDRHPDHNRGKRSGNPFFGEDNRSQPCQEGSASQNNPPVQRKSDNKEDKWKEMRGSTIEDAGRISRKGKEYDLHSGIPVCGDHPDHPGTLSRGDRAAEPAESCDETISVRDAKLLLRGRR